MIINRLGNKKAVAAQIVPHFPKHTRYFEPFFGAGGMFFNKPRARYNFLNDLDGEVINAFDIVLRRKNELREYLELVPYSQHFWDRCKAFDYSDELERAVFFIVLSNWGYLGKPNNMCFTDANTKHITIKTIIECYEELVKSSNQFTSFDFRKFFKSVNIKENYDIHNCFIYADPPYLNTGNNYNTPKWTETDSNDLQDAMQATGYKFAMSEFDHPFILEQAAKRNLNVITIGKRKNLKNRRTEILVTNYEKQNTLF